MQRRTLFLTHLALVGIFLIGPFLNMFLFYGRARWFELVGIPAAALITLISLPILYIFFWCASCGTIPSGALFMMLVVEIPLIIWSFSTGVFHREELHPDMVVVRFGLYSCLALFTVWSLVFYGLLWRCPGCRAFLGLSRREMCPACAKASKTDVGKNVCEPSTKPS